jgi:hypothetical protein
MNITQENEYVYCGSYYEMKIAYKDIFYTAYISTEDYPKVRTRHWRTSHKKNKVYVVSGSITKNNVVYLHNFILDYVPIEGYEVDHYNGNSLDNRRENLSIVSRQENIDNARVRCDNQLGIRGISYDKRKNNYKCDFTNHGSRVYFKHFNTLAEAAYCRMIVEGICGIDVAFNNPLVQECISQLSEDDKEEISQYAINKYCESNGL